MSDKFLRADGTVEWRLDAATVGRIVRDGGYVIGRGQLCTACLVGDWDLTMLKAAKTLCDECLWLEETVTRLAGAGRLSGAGRSASPDSRLRLDGASDPDDAAWEPIRAGRRLRSERLTEVFARAEEAGAPFVVREERGATARSLAYDTIERLDLIPRTPEDRVRRFADWLRVLAPEDHAVRADVLADVDGLAAALRAHQADVAVARARGDRPAARRSADRAWYAEHRTGVAVDRLLHHGHVIPVSHGITADYVAEHFPGWTWNECGQTRSARSARTSMQAAESRSRRCWPELCDDLADTAARARTAALRSGSTRLERAAGDSGGRRCSRIRTSAVPTGFLGEEMPPTARFLVPWGGWCPPSSAIPSVPSTSW